MPTTLVKLTHPETASQMAPRFGKDSSLARETALALSRYAEHIAAGSNSATLYVSNSESSASQATGTVTISSGSGTVKAVINGAAVSVTWATSDTATGTALKNAINASTDNRIAGVVTATDSSGVVTITAAKAGATGNDITLVASGTGVTASAATLTGGIATAASGNFTISSGSGTVGGSINGVSVTVTWGTSDTATATALAAAINASSNALIQNVVAASASNGVVTITAAEKGVLGNCITLSESGTGVTKSGARLTGGKSASFTTYTLS